MQFKIYTLFILIVFLGSGRNGTAQDTTYFTDNGNRVNNLQSADYYSTLRRDPSNSNKATLKTYFKSGKIRSEDYYSDYNKKLVSGESKSYYESGQLKESIEYHEGKMDGRVLSFWADGKPKRKDLFKEDKLVKGTCYNAKGQAIPHFPFLQMPEFPGGQSALMHYLGEKIRYPKRSRKHHITGEVLVKFVVNKKGYITDPRIAKSVDDDLSAEALRVVKSMPKWKPGYQDGEPINVEYNLPVRFVLQ